MARTINPAALREIRELVGINHRELASRCGIAKGTVSNIELGKHGVTPELTRKLATALGCSVDAITSPVPGKVPA